MRSDGILVLIGASAVGKTTVAKRLLDSETGFSFIRSMTTRQPRATHSDEYIHVTEEAFRRAVADGELLEYTEYAGYLYGTPGSEIERAYAEGKHPLMILDEAGLCSMRRSVYAQRVYAVYLYAPREVWEKRLYERELTVPSADGVVRFIRRKEKNEAEFATKTPQDLKKFDFCAENTDLETCVKTVESAFLERREMTDEQRRRLSEKLLPTDAPK